MSFRRMEKAREMGMRRNLKRRTGAFEKISLRPNTQAPPCSSK